MYPYLPQMLTKILQISILMSLVLRVSLLLLQLKLLTFRCYEHFELMGYQYLFHSSPSSAIHNNLDVRLHV
jgi:hypothetical protein